jgi:hypothetical protein
MAATLTTPVRVAGLNPILRNGPESYDEIKVGPCASVRAGTYDYRMWYEGINSAVYATSINGKTWTKQGVVLTGAVSPSWENEEMSPTSMVWDGSQWVLFFHAGNNEGPRRIGRATSPDLTSGGTWTKYGSNPILSEGAGGAWDELFIADTKVIYAAADSPAWRMWYVGRNAAGRGQVGYATSSDGLAWTKYGSNPVIAGAAGNEWGVMAVCPVRVSASVWFCYFVTSSEDLGTSQLNRADSVDGVTWTRWPSNPVLGAVTDDTLSDSVEVMADGSLYRIYYGQYDLVGDTLRGKGYAESQAYPFTNGTAA